MDTEPDSRDASRPKPAAKRAKGAYHFFRRATLLALTVYIVCVVLMMIFEESFIFFPSPYPDGDWQPDWLPFEDAWFQSADGTRLHGWYVEHETPRAVVLFCHGNAGNITHRAQMASVLHEVVGVSVLMFDYRGYGRSEGKPNEPGVLADARAARQWLAERAGIGEEDVVLMGRSLGGAVAVDLAALDGARALVLESTFSSMADLAAHHYPWLPVRWLLRTRLDSASKIADYGGPLLQSHGDADTIVPFRFGRRLFEAAHEPKTFITIPSCGHNDPQTHEYYAALIRLLDEVNRRPRPGADDGDRAVEE
ncbi:MAG: alpha/beta hydrolase [Planctomycetota bacterium]|jgi:fermentation-respiration switch protein FrsA (DUF1100 family)